ncbi:MAG: efflux RND transporter periplasmic adaptor subunit [Leptolyngbya sp. SIO1D8]|nr:efflux RND transporter periplasmic adaptor subunit [Leptolyngbya sp. SIO1D8]
MQIPLVGKIRSPLTWLLSLMTLGVIGLGVVAFVVNRNRGSAYDVNELTIPVQAAAITVRISASGTVEPVQTVNLSPKASGILEQLLVEQGDLVTQGQLIAQMESRDVEAQLRLREAAVAEAAAQLLDVQQGADSEAIAQAEATMRSAEAQVQDAAARLELAEAQLARNQDLQRQGAISINELDTFVQTARSAQAELERAQFQVRENRERLADLQNDPDPEALAQAEARLAQAQAQLQATQVQFADTQIRAPFAGTITQKFATEGAFVTPTTSASDASSATSTAIVALASDLEVLAEVSEADIAQIHPGQLVEIVADAFPDEVFQGEVRLIAPEAIERQNVTLFQVRIDLLSGQSVLLSNMNVSVAFIGDQLTDALVVPTVTVITQQGQSGVLVPGAQDRIRFRPVVLGSQVGDQIQILQGIAEGDRVFVDLPPGQTLENLNFGRDPEEASE